MIPKDTIEDIFNSARVEEVVGEFVTLKKRGANMLGNCPFHNEKTPSFTVSPAKGIYKCFGCGKAGNSVNFIMDHEQLTYPEALRWLAKKYNIHIQEEELTKEQKDQQTAKESLYIAAEFSNNFFVEQLHNSNEGKAIALSYFKERGFDKEIIDKFQLGYNPDKGNLLTKAATEGGYNLEFFEQLGLSAKGRNNDHYDKYRGRVIFPIHNLSGRVIGFGGRTLKTDKKVPKYINSPECDIYHKSRVLYGLFFAKKDISKLDNCYLVEGYTDVTSMHQAGIENVVSSSGTSLTEGQISLIKRYTDNITILYDGDAAGIKASFRGIDMILKQGMNVKIVLFPEGEDPDSYSKSVSKDDFKEFLDTNQKDFIVFKSSLLLSEAENDPILKSKVVHEIVDSIALIPDGIARSIYTKQCSEQLQIPEKALIAELNKVLRKNLTNENKRQQVEQRKSSSQQHPDEPPLHILYPEEYSAPFFENPKEQKESKSSCESQERDVIRILINYFDETILMSDDEGDLEISVAEFLVNEITTDDLKFENALYDKVFQVFVDSFENENLITPESFTRNPNTEIQNLAIELISNQERYLLSDWESKNIFVEKEDHASKMKRMLIEASYSFKIKKVEQMIFVEEQELKSIQNDPNKGDDMMICLQKLVSFKELKRQLCVAIGRPI